MWVPWLTNVLSLVLSQCLEQTGPKRRSRGDTCWVMNHSCRRELHSWHTGCTLVVSSRPPPSLCTVRMVLTNWVLRTCVSSRVLSCGRIPLGPRNLGLLLSCELYYFLRVFIRALGHFPWFLYVYGAQTFSGTVPVHTCFPSIIFIGAFFCFQKFKG